MKTIFKKKKTPATYSLSNEFITPYLIQGAVYHWEISRVLLNYTNRKVNSVFIEVGNTVQGASCVHDSPSPEARLPAAKAWLLFSSLVKTQNASLQDQSEMQGAGPLARKSLSLASPPPSPAAPAVPGKGCQREAAG